MPALAPRLRLSTRSLLGPALLVLVVLLLVVAESIEPAPGQARESAEMDQYPPAQASSSAVGELADSALPPPEPFALLAVVSLILPLGQRRSPASPVVRCHLRSRAPPRPLPA